MAQARTTAEATAIKRTVQNTPEVLDDSCLSIQEPLDKRHEAFFKTANDIRRQLQDFCTELQQSHSLSMHEQQPEIKGGCNRNSLPDHQN